MRTPGLVEPANPAAIIRGEPYEGKRPALDSSWGALFDFDPRYGMWRDHEGGIELARTGDVQLVNANGNKAAEFAQTGYLLGSASPFAALSDLTGGGVSTYIVAEDTGAIANQVAFALYENGASLADNSIRMYRAVSGNSAWTIACQDTVAKTDTGGTVSSRNQIDKVTGSATTTLRTVHNGVPGVASADVTAIDPASMDRVLIGAGNWAGAPNTGTFGFTGRVYRILVCEGAFNQAIADYLTELYTPRRLPPSIDPSDVVFLWDARNGMLRDTLNGITLSQASSPTRVSRAGDVAVYFDGSSDYLYAAWADAGDLAQEYTAYLVCEQIVTGINWVLNIADASAPLADGLQGVTRDLAASGATAYKEESSGGYETDHAGEISVVGQIHLATFRWSLTELEAWLDGVGDGASAATAVPRNLDRIYLGLVASVAYQMEGYNYYLLIARGGRDTAAETWLQANLPFGAHDQRRPPEATLAAADIVLLFDPRHSVSADTLNSNTFTTVGTPTRVGQNGDIAALVASGSYYTAPLALTDLDETYTMYAVWEPGASSQYDCIMSWIDSGDHTNENLGMVVRGTNAAWGSYALKEDTALGLAGDYAGVSVAGGDVVVSTCEFTTTTIEAWTDGTSNGSTASNATPNTLDLAEIGRYAGQGAAAGYLYFAMIVKGARDAAIETWINANFPIG